MRTRWPFGGFFLKLSDEKNGTHEYEDYLRECREHPFTAEEEREWEENSRKAHEELARMFEEAEQKSEAEIHPMLIECPYGCVEPEPPDLTLSSLPKETPYACSNEVENASPDTSEEDSADIEVVPPEAVVLMPTPAHSAETPRYLSDKIGESFQGWGNGRVLMDAGTGCGKSEFIVQKLARWAVDKMIAHEPHRILCLCPLTVLHKDLEKRRREAFIQEFGEAVADDWDVYKDVLTVETYQYIEKLCKKNPEHLQKFLARHQIIVADECHYWSEFSSFNPNTHYSLQLLLEAENNHTVVYMSATGQRTWKLLEDVSSRQPSQVYQMPQSYRHVKAAYFYSRYNLVTILKSLPAGEKAIVFVELGDDLVEMQKIFGDAAGYYCSPNNEKYHREFSNLAACIKDGETQKDIIFATKAIGVGIGLKDRNLKHIFIDQWNPIEVAQSLGRKRPLDDDDTCTVYFRNYGLDWYWGTKSGLKKFRNILENKLKPAQAYMAGEEEFKNYLMSADAEVIQSRIDKSKLLEHNVVEGYHLNPLGMRQVQDEIDTLNDIMATDDYPKSFTQYALFDLHQPIEAYRFHDFDQWLHAHLNQPMEKEQLREKILQFGYIEPYKDYDVGQAKLNDYLLGYHIKIMSGRDKKRKGNRDGTFWMLTQISD